MKKFLHRTLTLFLTFSLVCSASAAASEALGEDLTTQDTLLNQETQLSTNVFWSSAYSDLRTENLITYTPNKDVTPIVTYGDTLTACNTLSSMAKRLEDQGHRVVAGLNGDFYNVGTGLPIGLVVSEGQLRSSDGGYYAIGFREDGSAVLGKPGLKVTADLGYESMDPSGFSTRILRQMAGVNKARVSTGGIYLYTYDFNAKHTTGSTEPGVDVICTIEDGELSIGSELTLTVDEVREAATPTVLSEDQVVLSVNLLSNAYYVDALRNVPQGTTITLTATAADEAWNDVDYAVGALYSLVENGGVAGGLPKDVNPRTAVGQKSDGTLVFYTIDGRRSGHSIGASMTQVAQRLIELGCVTALCLDGGGSTTLTVTEPDDITAKTINTPSDGSERAVSNQIFLVADSEPSDRLSHFYVKADSQYVLAGSKVHITASAVDTNFIPMEDEDFDLTADDGQLDGDTLTTPDYGCKITVTADRRGKTGSTTVYAVETPDDVAIRNSANDIITSLNVAPGSATDLTATAAYKHRPLKADRSAFRWSVDGNIGTIDDDGVFTAAAPGTGTITVSAGGRKASVEVTVSKMALKTVEDFENGVGSIRGASGISPDWRTDGDHVRMGRGAVRLGYTDLNRGPVTAPADYTLSPIYTQLNLWVRGDGSGNTLYLETSDDWETTRTAICTLDQTGWTQVSVTLPDGTTAITGFTVEGVWMDTVDPATGEFAVQLTTPDAGEVYLDQIVASYNGIVDNDVPAITLTSDGERLTAAITDAVDGVLPKSAVSVTWDGAAQDFAYNQETGALSTSQVSDGRPHRITITARDASGNIGRASCDLPTSPDWTPLFTDTKDYWGAAYADFLYNANITTGYEDGTFRPNQNITRAQFSVMLYRYLELDESKYADVVLPFADLKAIPGYAIPAVKALYTEGIINGSTGKNGQLYFNPGASLTRAQAATMIGRTQEKGYTTVELTFTDAGKIPAYAAYYIQTMAAQGIIGGYTDGTFRPAANITRGQMAKILYNLL